MSLLDQLWDDTVAGPRPDSGLGKLRKQSSLGFLSVNSADVNKVSDGGNMRSGGDTPARVTRSITILKPPVVGDQSETPPASPAGSTTPNSPFSMCLDAENFKNFKLVERKQLSHNVAEFKFALPTPTSVLGLPIGQHISCRGKDSQGEEVIKPKTSTTLDSDVGHFKLVIKKVKQQISKGQYEAATNSWSELENVIYSSDLAYQNPDLKINLDESDKYTEAEAESFESD
uniref:Flavoprotein pyridine nucleotide cytochrome reductase-like FAD-binding domain-containing protein n=1 Tax=Daucus carota subsp. sativus TaxID=79200 RepID=A0A166I3L4_DAUCS